VKFGASSLMRNMVDLLDCFLLILSTQAGVKSLPQ